MSRTKTEYMIFRFGEEEVGDEGVLFGGDYKGSDFQILILSEKENLK